MKSAREAFISHGSLRHKGRAIAHPKHHQRITLYPTGTKVQKTSEKKHKKGRVIDTQPFNLYSV